MNISELRDSKFLKRADVGDGTTVTITGVEQVNVAKEGAPEEMKWAMHVAEFDKAMVLNSTNGQLIAHALKSDDSDDWTGKQVVLYDDPSVSFGGKLVGGIRVRAVPKTGGAKPAASPAPGAKAGSVKAQLKARFRAHPKFGTDLKPDDINGHLLKQYGVKLDDLSEEAAQEVMRDFDEIVEELSIPF